MRIILLGAPGSGKGTLSHALVGRCSIAHLSTGDMLREAVSQGTEIGKKAKSYMEKGELVPDEVILEIMSQRLDQPDCSNGFILDGFPRTVAQATALDEQLRQSGIAIDIILNLEVPEDVLIQRLTSRRTCSNPSCQAIYNVISKPPKAEGKCDLCGAELIQRDDETPEAIEKRLVTYNEKTAPLIDYYESRPQFMSLEALDSNKILKVVLERGGYA